MKRTRSGRRHPDLDFDESDDSSEAAAPTSIGDWISYAKGSLRRRPIAAIVVFCIAMLGTIAYYARAKPMYQVETRVLAQRQLVMPSSVRSNPGNEAPTRTAEELIRRRDNLLDVVKSAGLLNGSTPGDDPLSAFIARTAWKLGLGPDPATLDPVTAMVLRLDKALTVSTTEETIKISVKWRNPIQAYQIVERVLQNFLEARQTQEITALDEGIALLQARLATLRAQLDREEARRDDSRRVESFAPEVGGAPARSSGPAPLSGEAARVKSLLEAKERAIRDMEDFRRRKLLELQSQLDEKRNVYADAHPVVIGLRNEIESLSGESAQVVALREQERQLRDEYAQLVSAGRARSDLQAQGSRSVPLLRGGGNTQDDRVKDVRAQYLQTLERVNGAQLELDAIRAAFKHRYKVVWPAEIPREPVSPNPWKTFPAGLLGSLLLAIAVAVIPDLRSRRIYEDWQVEQSLDLEILTDLGPQRRQR